MKKIIAFFGIFTASAFLLAGCGLLGADAQQEESLTVSTESLSVSPKTMTLYLGETEQLEAELKPAETTDIPEFSSSREDVVSVDSRGNLTALQEGEAVITVSVGALKATCKVSAQVPPIREISFAESAAQLKVSETLTLEVTQLPENAEPGEYEFSSADPRIATVDESGVVTATGVGNTCIYATLKSDASVRCILDLTTECDAPIALDFEENYYALLPDGEESLALCVEPFGMYVNDIQWFSSDESVVTVDQDGTAVGHSRGTATITAISGDLQAECIVAVTRRLAPDPVDEIAEGRYTESPEGILQRENAAESDSAQLMLIGDLMCLSAQQNAARTGNTWNFNSSFSIVKDIFAKSDFCIGNLETLVSYSNAYAAEQKEKNGNPNCNGPATYLDAVKAAGLDAVVAANNHCSDGGAIGVYETLQQLRKYKIPVTGIFAEEQDPRYLIAEVNGIKIGIASYTGHFNGGGRQLTEEERSSMLNLYSPEKVRADVAAMKEAGAEYIIAYMHWGTENTHQVNAKQKQQAQEIADAGVDFIAGSHPHCLQPAETLTAADGREVFCIYSLGNFVSSMGRTINNDTIILNVTLKRSGEQVVLEDAGYIGCRVIGSYNGGSYVVVPNREQLNGGISTSALQSAQERIAKVMGDSLREITELN